MRHAEVSRAMFPGRKIAAITNGVHAATWTSLPSARLFDQRIPDWRRDNGYLRYAVGLPPAEIREAHIEAKKILLDQVRRRTGAQLNETAFTIGFARRAATYKRGDLLFSDLERLKSIARQSGSLQIIYAGKAHPRDEGGKAIIRQDIRSGGGDRRFHSGRLPRKLRHGFGSDHLLGRRLVAEHADATARSLWHERHESGAERSAELERSRWMVDRRTHRRGDRVVDRRRK
jgi:hypothetical protein